MFFSRSFKLAKDQPWVILADSVFGKADLVLAPTRASVSRLPLNLAPSAIEIRGHLISPCTDPENLISTMSLA
jgi:hypothetical protein